MLEQEVTARAELIASLDLMDDEPLAWLEAPVATVELAIAQLQVALAFAEANADSTAGPSVVPIAYLIAHDTHPMRS